jgi:periplasmic copper chaperone A
VSSARQRRLAVSRSVAVALGALLCAVALGACGAGQLTQTSEQVAAVNGGFGQAGPIAIRNLEFVYPTGGDHYYHRGSTAPLTGVIVNTGGMDDQLVSASSPAASSVLIAGQKQIPGRNTLRLVEANAATGQGTVHIALQNLTQDIKPGRTVPVTFLFQQFGEVTIDTPIANPDEPRSPTGH